MNQKTYFISIGNNPNPARLTLTEEPGPTFQWALTSAKVNTVGRAMRDTRAVSDALAQLAEAFNCPELAVTPEGSPTHAEMKRRAEAAVDPEHVRRVTELAAKAIELARAPQIMWERALEYAKHLGNLLPDKAEETKKRHFAPAVKLADEVAALAVTVQSELRRSA